MNSRLVRVIVLCGLAFSLGLSAPIKALACEDVNPHNGYIRVNEFLPNPLTEQKEWIELFLYSGESILLNGWQLHDASGKIASLSGTVTHDAPYLLIELTSAKLNNSGDTISLINTDGEIVDSITYSASTEKTESFAYDDTTNQFIITASPTPGKNNIITISAQETQTGPPTGDQAPTSGPGESESDVLQGADTPTNTPAISAAPALTLLITEVFPNPKDQADEFIELYNPNTSTVSLINWKLKDNTTKLHKLAGEILAESYLVIEKEQTGISLNNTGSESVYLLNPDGEEIASTTYENAPELQSWSLVQGGAWAWTTTLTPGEVNQFSALPESESIQNTNEDVTPYFPLAEISGKELGTKLTTKGVVSVLPGVLGSQFFYINGSGIQVYMFSKDFPELQVGDEIAVTGELSESNGELRIKTSEQGDIVVIGTKELLAKEVTIGEITDELIASLVQTKGVVTEKTSDHLYIDDGFHEIKIDTKTLSSPLQTVMTDQELIVTGIVRPRSDGLTIFPRGDFDIQVVSNTQETSTTTVAIPGADNTGGSEFELPMFQSVLVIIATSVLLVFFRKQKQTDEQQKLPLRNPVKIKTDTGLEPQIAELVALHQDLR